MHIKYICLVYCISAAGDAVYVAIEFMRLASQDHVTKPTAILSGKKCTVAFVRVRVYVRFVAMGRAVALLGVQTGTRKVRI